MIQQIAGNNLVNPSEYFNDVVAIISNIIADPNKTYCITFPPCNKIIIQKKKGISFVFTPYANPHNKFFISSTHIHHYNFKLNGYS